MATPAICVYDTQTNQLFDLMQERGISCYTKKTMPELVAAYGAHLVELPIAEAMQRKEDAAKTEPREIDEETYLDALNVLPPGQWITSGGASSFHLIEMYTGSVSKICVQVGRRFFTYRDTIKLTHAERVAKCQPLLAGE